MLVNCTTTDANHDRATARPNERTNETKERQDQKTEPSHYYTRAETEEKAGLQQAVRNNEVILMDGKEETCHRRTQARWKKSDLPGT